MPITTAGDPTIIQARVHLSRFHHHILPALRGGFRPHNGGLTVSGAKDLVEIAIVAAFVALGTGAKVGSQYLVATDRMLTTVGAGISVVDVAVVALLFPFDTTIPAALCNGSRHFWKGHGCKR